MRYPVRSARYAPDVIENSIFSDDYWELRPIVNLLLKGPFKLQYATKERDVRTRRSSYVFEFDIHGETFAVCFPVSDKQREYCRYQHGDLRGYNLDVVEFVEAKIVNEFMRIRREGA